MAFSDCCSRHSPMPFQDKWQVLSVKNVSAKLSLILIASLLSTIAVVEYDSAGSRNLCGVRYT